MIEEVSASGIAEYAAIPIAFEVRERVDPDRASVLGTLAVDAPYRKDYDAHSGFAPRDWPSRFDLGEWLLLVARDGERAIGAAAVAPRAVMIDMDIPGDSSVLWDLRVAPEARRSGVATALFRRAAGRARERGAAWLVAETQDINVAACRFYARMGMRLTAFDPGVYPGLPDEARMIWRLDLRAAGR